MSGFFSKLESEVQNGFAAIESLYSGSTVDNVGEGANTSSSMQLPNLAFTPANFLSGTQVNWLIEKLEKVFGLDSGTTIPTDNLTQQAAATLWSAAGSAWTDLWNGIQSFVQAIETSIKQPSDFRQMAMTDLLNGLEEIILAALTFADGICEAFLQLINAVLAAINNVLNAQIQIPLIPKILDEFGLGEVTALNLCSLMIALPVSVCYELLTDGSPLFTDAQVRQITSGNSEMAMAAGDNSGVATAISFCNAGVTLLWAVYDTILDLFKTSPPIGLQITDAIFPVVLQVFGWPGGIPFTAIPVGTTTEKWTLGNWSCGFATPLVDAGLLIAGTQTAGTTGVLRYRVLTIRTDHGHEFQAKVHWHVADLGINRTFIRVRTPRLNGKVERSHRTGKVEFDQLLSYTDDSDLNEKLAAWENVYNYFRPHRSLTGKTPYEVLSDKLQCDRNLSRLTHTR